MKNISTLAKVNLGMLMLVLFAASYAYAKYWNIATVNGHPISRIDFIKTMEKAGGKQTLDQMIQETLILDEGKKNNITMDKKAMEAEMAKVEERIKAQGQTLDVALAQSGMTKADLEKQILIQKIETTLAVSKTEITKAQIDDFIKTYKSQLPSKATQAELETLAKEELTTQASKSAATEWIANLTKNAKVVSRL